MVAFVSVENVISWVRETGPEVVIAGMAEYVEDAYRRWDQFDKTPRVACHSEFGTIELMPVADDHEFGFKHVNCHPINSKVGRQTVTAFGALADVESGYPTFLSEMTLLTALRTAATSALAAGLLARPASTTMAIIGAGAQSEFQALAFRSRLGIESLRVWDVDPDAVKKLQSNLVPLGFDVQAASSVHDACRGVDVITTCTADWRMAMILEDDAVPAGAHINAIGGDCPGKTELDPAILKRSTVVVEFAEQTRLEGEIQQLEPNFPVTELCELVAGQHGGRTSDDEITIFDSVGFAIEDHAALRYLRDATTGTRFVEEIDLVTAPADPKNLFGLLSSGI